ncbi:hypothetical protein IHI24_000923 [Rickettsia endosymbiont of Cardiosporidium cionae]|nr:hypothetical protein IHI24_000923 [Rickettsia endosymbiont of Cardiosporidium cionae]
MSAARARGRFGGRPAKITTRKLRIIMDAMKDRNTIVKDLAADLGISPKLIYRYISPEGELREHGKKLLDSENKKKKK